MRVLVLLGLGWAAGAVMGCGASDDAGGPGADSAPEPVHLGDCRMRHGYNVFSLDPAVRESVEGSNGLFAESCDAEGNLVIYNCEMKSNCGQGIMDCSIFPTGVVLTGTSPCAGTCSDGVCVE